MHYYDKAVYKVRVLNLGMEVRMVHHNAYNAYDLFSSGIT